MKICCSLLCLLLLAGSQLHAQNDAGAYMTSISNAHADMQKTYMTYISAAAHGRREKKVEKLRQQTLESITQSRYNVIGLPLYNGDNSLRQGSIDFIQFCYKIFNEDYAHIVNMEEIAEQSVDQMQAYLLLQEKTDEKLKEANEARSNIEKAFAAKYHVNLVESKDELSEKMEASSKLNRYSNEVFIVFFKANWEDNQLTQALNNKKLNEAEQAKNALLKFATDGLKELEADSLRSFQHDPSLANACKEALRFYQKMAANDVPKLMDYYLKEENFAKIKKAMEAKPDRTKEDVAEYNKAVKEMNAGVDNFNKTNQALNATRTQALQTWSNTEKEFKDLHTPYYKK